MHARKNNSVELSSVRMISDMAERHTVICIEIDVVVAFRSPDPYHALTTIATRVHLLPFTHHPPDNMIASCCILQKIFAFSLPDCPPFIHRPVRNY